MNTDQRHDRLDRALPAHFGNSSCLACRYLAALVIALLPAACDRLDMYDQPRYEPMEPSEFFADGESSRAPPPGTVARGQLPEDEPRETGKRNGRFVSKVPVEVDRTLLARGQERYQ